MIVVTGATGQLGRLVIAALLKTVPAGQIVAAVRSPEKAGDLAALGVQVRRADYTDAASLDVAFQGAKKILLISSNEIGARLAQHRAVVDAAKRAKVQLLAYTSVLRADTSKLGLAAEHLQTEQAIKDSGVPAAILRNGWYTENYTAGVPGALAQGAIYGSAGNGRISSAARSDYAEAAAVVLAGEGQAGKIYELAGDSAYTLTELAAEVSRQSGKTVEYRNIPEADYKAALIGFGLPEAVATLLSDSDTAASGGALFDEGRQLSTLIGRPTTPWASSVAAVLK
ncbi:putative nucleoside-diphosphate sugar epimerase [Herbaspirillum sp. CF444]|uniref:SDR family oxidoreductase n=1 Tax=Herbaspirillum sp. CF444 TaxID=1144319 RepID=UPI0002724BEE|nr:SDR family oxidoreductase [Herbaspirillum sp. CF444]EJL88369.1 putative nucleoside-diphosphate sugar epimerase [Herbaspirillum sp. CF444]